MRRTNYLFAAICLLGAAAPALANFLVEMTLEQKFARAELVVVGTVTAINRGTGRYRADSTATLDIARTFKGEATGSMTVSTYSRIAEANPGCCVIGATYLMFLGGSGDGGPRASINGPYGMIRIGGSPNAIEVIPADRFN